MTTATPYAPQIKIPELLERGKSQVSTLPVYRDGILQAPTSVKYTLIAPNGVKLVDGASWYISRKHSNIYTRFKYFELHTCTW
jgi:hypothetical protein